MSEVRLQKIIAEAGIASRRGAEKLITDGRVRLNGKVVSELGTKGDPDRDSIEVDGKRISLAEKKIYCILNKPRGYVTSMKDPRGRPTVADLVSEISERVFPVGRLDYDSSGLLIMTNDGELANALAHPKKEVEKCYQVKINGIPPEKELDKLRTGVRLTDGQTAPAKVKSLKIEKGKAWIEIIIHEGKNRQVRRMFEAIGFRVMKLSRVRIGPIRLGTLAPGKVRQLQAHELKKLKELLPEQK